MPTIESIDRRVSARRSLFTKPAQIGKRWDGVFRLTQSFRRVKARTEPAYVYATYDDRRIMQAIVDAYVSAMLDRLATRAAYGYIGDVLTTEEDKQQFAYYVAGRKETLVGEVELIHLSQLLQVSKISSRYSADTLGAYVAERFNKQRPLGRHIAASIEFKDVVLISA